MLDVGSMALKMRIFEKQKITPCIFQVPVASSKNPLTPIHAWDHPKKRLNPEVPGCF